MRTPHPLPPLPSPGEGRGGGFCAKVTRGALEDSRPRAMMFHAYGVMAQRCRDAATRVRGVPAACGLSGRSEFRSSASVSNRAVQNSILFEKFTGSTRRMRYRVTSSSPALKRRATVGASLTRRPRTHVPRCATGEGCAWIRAHPSPPTPSPLAGRGERGWFLRKGDPGCARRLATPGYDVSRLRRDGSTVP